MPRMGMLSGFGVSGYRSLSGPVQWIPLDAAVTVFLGGNNSGKSNVLRLLNQHMGPIFESLKVGGAIAFDPRIDAPRDSGDVGLRIQWPLDVESMADSPRLNPVRHDL